MDSCEQGNEYLGSMKGGGFPWPAEWLPASQVLKLSY
jgi:hypothetical protein